MLLNRDVVISTARRVIVIVNIQVDFHASSGHDVVQVLDRLAAFVDPDLPHVLGAFARSVARQLVQELTRISIDTSLLLPSAVDSAHPMPRCLHVACLVAHHEVHAQVSSGSSSRHTGITCTDNQQIGSLGTDDLVLGDLRLRRAASRQPHSRKRARADSGHGHKLTSIHFGCTHRTLLLYPGRA